MSAFIDDDAAALNIYNNIIFNNSATGNGNDIFVVDDNDENNTGSTVNLFYNDFSDFFSLCENTEGCTSNINQGSNIDAEPLFEDAPDGDIHLEKGSPCIDAGDPNAPALPDTDFEGDPRDVDADGDGTTPDMGADEFVPRGGGNGCSIAAGGVGGGEVWATLVIPLISGFAIGLKTLRRMGK